MKRSLERRPLGCRFPDLIRGRAAHSITSTRTTPELLFSGRVWHPKEHWRRVRADNPLRRMMREIRRPTREVGAIPDSNSALNLAADRLRHSAGTRWSTKRYLNMDLLRQRNAMNA